MCGGEQRGGRTGAAGMGTVAAPAVGMAAFGTGTPTSKIVGRDLPPSSAPACGARSARPSCFR
jgi:hypothetical protein